MAFGQSSGPAASARQVKTLLELLNNAGHTDFRDARGPMGFTQRQAGGKFTISEAEEFIEQLEQEEFIRGDSAASAKDAPVRLSAAEKAAERALLKALGDCTSEQLAAELQRRGWAVIEP